MGYPYKYPGVFKKTLARTIAQAQNRLPALPPENHQAVRSLMSMYTRRELEPLYQGALEAVDRIAAALPKPKPIKINDAVMQKRIKAVMVYRRGDYFVGEMVSNQLIYILKKLHGVDYDSPITTWQFGYLVNQTFGEELERIYKALEAYIKDMLKNDICPTCGNPKTN